MIQTTPIAQQHRMVELLSTLATKQGISPSPIEDVRFMRANKCIPRTPVVYDPSIVIVAQGRKIGYLGDQTYTYDAQNYLVLSVPMPFECETFASAREPLLAVSLRVDVVALSELLLEIDDAEVQPQSSASPRGMYATPLTDELSCAVVRLLEALQSPGDARILGPQIVREITYRVLQGEQGGALRAVAARHSHFGQISRALRRIHTQYDNALDVETLAREAHMSVSGFHHNFKAVTSTSPLQYLKSIRLHKARLLMVQEGLGASLAATRVGYESPSQFSREFKRFFGNSPVDEAAKMRAMMA